ncbi:MAG TPA: YraN family protein [Anaerolineales bacterium]|jgi:putative endonuclease|nr:YraN family protein [Anaerolineales bacterium]
MTKHNQRIGKWGEDFVTSYLAGRGYEILARNARTPYGEIDIITKQGEITVFIEVKTLTSSKNFFPEQNVTSRKQAHMLACAEHYAMENDIDHWQIDVIAVEGKVGVEPKITHFENAIQ